MGLLSRKLMEARVFMWGVEDYANPHTECRPIRAGVQLRAPQDDLPDLGCARLALLVPLAATRMLHLSEVAPGYGSALMELTKDVAGTFAALGEDSARQFKVRDVASDPPAASSFETTQLRDALAVLDPAPDRPHDRLTTLKLVRRRGGGSPWASVNAPTLGGPIIASAALFAAFEHAAATRFYDRETLPAAAGLLAVVDLWEEMGRPDSVPLGVANVLDQVVIEVVTDPAPLKAAAGVGARVKEQFDIALQSTDVEAEQADRVGSGATFPGHSNQPTSREAGSTDSAEGAEPGLAAPEPRMAPTRDPLPGFTMKRAQRRYGLTPAEAERWSHEVAELASMMADLFGGPSRE